MLHARTLKRAKRTSHAYGHDEPQARTHHTQRDTSRPAPQHGGMVGFGYESFQRWRIFIIIIASSHPPLARRLGWLLWVELERSALCLSKTSLAMQCNATRRHGSTGPIQQAN